MDKEKKKYYIFCPVCKTGVEVERKVGQRRCECGCFMSYSENDVFRRHKHAHKMSRGSMI